MLFKPCKNNEGQKEQFITLKKKKKRKFRWTQNGCTVVKKNNKINKNLANFTDLLESPLTAYKLPNSLLLLYFSLL